MKETVISKETRNHLLAYAIPALSKPAGIGEVGTIKTANGTLVSAHYGKIYGAMDVSNQVMMTDLDNSGCTIYFNPVGNDPSIEFGEKIPRSMQKGKKRPEGHLP